MSRLDRSLPHTLCLACLTCGLLLLPSPCWSQTPAAADEVAKQASTSAPDETGQPDKTGQPDETLWIRDLAARAVQSVVLVTVEGRDGRQDGLGSGFVIDADGLIATNLHVLGEARPITVRFPDGRSFAANEVYASDQQYDLAIIRIEAHDLPALPLIPASEQIPQGLPIVALGNPMGLEHSIVSGIVSGHREIDGRQMLQIAMPIEPGNSGGPVLNRAGQVLGVVTLKSAVTANLGFATEAAGLRALLEHPNPIAIERWITIGSLDSAEWTTVHGANWRNQSGHIVVTEAGDGFGGRSLCLRQQEPPELPYEVGAYVKLDDESGAAGLAFAADGKDEHFGFYPSNGRIRLTHFQGPTVYSWRILSEFATPHYRHGEWNHLKVRLEKDKLQGYVNDQLVITWPLDSPLSGQIGLAKFRDTRVRFRQFESAAEIAPTQLDPQRLAKAQSLIHGGAPQTPVTELSIEKLAADPAASRIALQLEADRLQRVARRYLQVASDVHVGETVKLLQASLEDQNDPHALARAALYVSRLDNPELEVAPYLSQLERMSGELRGRIQPDTSEADRLSNLHRYLFSENGFHGSRTHYYQAANSHLDRAIDDREGLPITLAIIYLDLGRQLNLNLAGIGLPGHFVVRQQPSEATASEATYIDVFSGGVKLDTAQIQRLIRQATEGTVDDAYLAPMSSRDIVLRVLRNLQGVAERQRDTEAMLRYLEAMVALAPDEPAYRGQRAVVRQQTGRRAGALADLDWFLEHEPPGIDLDAIRGLRQRFSESPDPATNSRQ
ncbi:MAG: tetratricopeptide repeat protein [Planctomycetales bacterium]|nr:tetratricopeptide repeat protein [Planctomycetales bacterium]